MRKRYETASDRQAEKAILDAFIAYRMPSKAWSQKPDPAKADTSFDAFIIHERRIKCVVEIKDRRGWKPEYGTVILGAEKVVSLQKASFFYAVPALFVVRLHDGIYYIKVPQVPQWEVGVNGRKDRGDDADIELCYRIPFSEFSKVS